MKTEVRPALSKGFCTFLVTLAASIAMSAVFSGYSGVVRLNLGWGIAEVTIDGTGINKEPELLEVAE